MIRIALAVSATVACVVSSVVSGQSVATAAAQPSLASGKAEKVIVVLRDQLRSLPAKRTDMSARATKAGAAQSAVLARLGGPKVTNVRHLAVANAFTATMTTSQAAALAHDAAIAAVVKDAAVPMPAASAASEQAQVRSGRVTPKLDGPLAICPSDPAQPLVEPEALQSIHALTTDGSPNAQDLTTGAGVKVAYIADGIDPNNPDFIRTDGSHVIVDYQDFSGDGPDAPSGGGEAFGDASSIAAQGTVSHDLSEFVNPAYPLPPGCNIRIVGVAPDASIVALKAGGEFLTNSSILQSIDYAVRVDHVDVINESFGLNQFPDDSNRNTVELFNDAAVAAGVTVTESTGDGGVTGTIGSDSQDPKVISVGATTDARLYAQTGYAAARAFGNGLWVNDNISALSSGGTTNYGRTLDLVAPGEANWAACEPGFSSCVNFRGTASDIQAFGGTSESAPLTAGVAALVISAYRSTHAGASPSPAAIKQIITGTASDLSLPPDEQGSGLLDARAATEAALTWPGSTDDPSGLPANIVTSTNQVTLTGAPNSTHGATVHVTNVGDTATTVAMGTRGFAQLSSSAQAIAFDSSTLPTFPYPTNGTPWAFRRLVFHVPDGADRLLTHLAWAGSRPSGDAIVRLSLFAPDGTYVADSRPQGGPASANYANVDVRHPVGGTWTALLYSPAGSAGYTGIVGLLATASRAVAVGSVTPAVLHLAPGAGADVHFSFTLPSTASGDQTYAVTLATSAGRRTAVSAVVRTQIDTSGGDGTFSGFVTGGNARAVTPGETFSYQFRVPVGEPSLASSVMFGHNPDSVVDLVLIDPNGELADVVSNMTLNAAKSGFAITRTIQSLVANPVAGLWHLVVVVQNPVSGTAFSQPFRGHVRFTAVPVDRGDLPGSTSTSLTRGVTATTTITVTNPGVQPIFVGVDPRLNHRVTLQPVPTQGQSTFALPPNPALEPIYSIPPDTTSLTVVAQSTTPAQLELQGSAAGFDLFGDLSAAQNGDLLSVASVSQTGGRSTITKGIWFTNVQQIGPFTDAGAPSGQTTMTASMDTLAFDSAVSTSTRDPFGNSIDPNNNGFGHAVRILPGQSKQITVAITPTGPSGSTVSGHLNVVTVPTFPSGSGSLPFVTTGEVIATVPYAYTVK